MSHNSDDSSFKVILTGSLLPGTSLEEAEQRLSQLFNTTPEKVRPLLQGHATTIKNNLNAEKADKYRQVLAKVGVGFEIIEERPKPSPQPKKPVVISQRETNILNNEKNSEPLLFLKNLHYPKRVKSQDRFELNEEIEELQRQIDFIYQESKGPIFINLQDRYNFFWSISIIMQIMVMIAVGIATTWYWGMATIIPAIFIFPYFISLFNTSLEHKYLQFLLKELWQHPRISDPLFLAVFHYTSFQGIESISTALLR